MQGLKGKVAIVTGGATMIGAAVVRAFQREGTRVVIADINDEAGQAVANSLGKDVLFVKTDLAVDAQIAACVDHSVSNFGGIDFLVNLACVYIDDALNATRKDWLDSYNINVVGGVMMLKARSEEHTSELQSRLHLVCRLLLEKKKKTKNKEIYVSMI